MTRLLFALRQLTFPRELRIHDTGINLPPLLPSDLKKLLAQDDALDRLFIKKLATTAWRLGRQARRLDDSGPGSRIKSRLEVLSDLLKDQGIEVVDYSGKPYDPNELWDEVISSQEEKKNPCINSMQEPRVIYRGAVIQRGQPIVEDVEH